MFSLWAFSNGKLRARPDLSNAPVCERLAAHVHCVVRIYHEPTVIVVPSDRANYFTITTNNIMKKAPRLQEDISIAIYIYCLACDIFTDLYYTTGVLPFFVQNPSETNIVK